MRHRIVLLFGIVAGLVILAAGLLGFTGNARTAGAPTGTPSVIPTAYWATGFAGAPGIPAPPGPPHWPTPAFTNPNFTPVPPTISPQVGVPAIPPTIKSSDPKAATFTEQDVRNYLTQSHNKVHPNDPMPAIMNISFLTVAQAGSTLSLPLPLDRNELVCVLQSSQAGTMDGRAYTTVVYVFSAHTGNLLFQMAK